MSGYKGNTSVAKRIKRLAETRGTPFLAIDRKEVTRRYRSITRALPESRIFYAVKANPHRKVIELLHSLGCGFEISSEQELKLVLGCGVPSEQIISSNPLKNVSFIEAAHEAGVRYFAFDSHNEIEKLAEFAPGSNVYVRLAVPNEESQWPLARKFGVETATAAQLLIEASRKPLNPCGITFHVGSQCPGKSAWKTAIQKSRAVWETAEDAGLKLSMLNLGGGFPIKYTSSVPSVSDIARTILHTLEGEFPRNITTFIEPGRALVGDAGVLVSSVIAKARRDGENWLYLDVGVFNGLLESLGGIQYSLETDSDGDLVNWVLAGPSCDSMDVISNRVVLPELEIGDKVYIMPAGAYTTAYASRFNGISIPKVYYI
ncbi:MAG: type III PLP-dependent enzyme [Dehalococcoidia bacterium]